MVATIVEKNFTVRFYLYDLSLPHRFYCTRSWHPLVGNKISPSSSRPPAPTPPLPSRRSLPWRPSHRPLPSPPLRADVVTAERRLRLHPPSPERHLGLGGRPLAPAPRQPRVSARNRPWPGLSGAPARVACSRRWSATKTPRRRGGPEVDSDEWKISSVMEVPIRLAISAMRPT